MYIDIDSQTGEMTITTEPNDDFVMDIKDIPIEVDIPALEVQDQTL